MSLSPTLNSDLLHEQQLKQIRGLLSVEKLLGIEEDLLKEVVSHRFRRSSGVAPGVHDTIFIAGHRPWCVGQHDWDKEGPRLRCEDDIFLLPACGQPPLPSHDLERFGLVKVDVQRWRLKKDVSIAK